ncbi:hypothetical protein M1446_04565 [Candidatus Dependentiae bacterium]|nr:hypothetical protein [Candidatus Dependentiae bacterium]
MKKLLILSLIAGSIVAMEKNSVFNNDRDIVNYNYDEYTENLTLEAKCRKLLSKPSSNNVGQKDSQVLTNFDKLQRQAIVNQDPTSEFAYEELLRACRYPDYEIKLSCSKKLLKEYGLIDYNYKPKPEVKALLQNKIINF